MEKLIEKQNKILLYNNKLQIAVRCGLQIRETYIVDPPEPKEPRIMLIPGT